ncbi:NAD(P)H-dependent glycerol-3-phosphate dehydrogenase [Mobiluncus mulieris]|uniref:Glycerol-3-phosphate dehydrogenase n=1 Tax=Mobiluncus mulieris TaxID=2052 RepID=A0A7Y0U0S1_9ACTO|nr:NAD(P)H-dependent glycerol-3-phosphate dehydrogenase [Mobiluncus mulieris]NMW64836.1 glycerol-3-phosphate dehydrogenase [Mobiluncus mulieris]NMX03818.1 glycerol-3-phosphate dehydrogenase [Mobiluncus mulieris]NMX12311.1 glycerol-3-phosphate dehydrogenase [Mobiluncus mulieris]
MSTITILGAGAMGSALCTPMIDAGWEVRLWGTWLDDHLLDAVEAGKNHPRTNEPLAQGVKLYRSDELEKALDGANVVVMSVASVGVAKVTELALPGIVKADALWLTSKGFCAKEDGEIQLLPDAIRRIAATQGYDQLPPIVAIAGPVKANECAAREPTATIFGCRDGQVSLRYARQARSQTYAIEASDDEVGVEICAPMKNVYAIALGIADGLQEATGVPHHNLKAATFSQAVREMSLLGAALGAKESTAFGLAGVGDLEVTGLSGRNKFYGVRLGRGENPQEALDEMARLEQTVEGVPAAALAQKFVSQKAPNLVEKLPLLQAVVRILDGKVEDVKSVVGQAVLPVKP